jgi:hypothetical protein
MTKRSKREIDCRRESPYQQITDVSAFHPRDSVSNHGMRGFVIAVLLLPALTEIGAAWDNPKSDAAYDVKRCAPKSSKERKPPKIQLGSGERYRNAPVVAYEILESGEIAHHTLKRSSGVADVDKYALWWVRQLKFNKRPECGIVASTVDLTIDFR